VVPELQQRVEARFNGFADRVGLLHRVQFKHRVDVVLPRDSVEIEAGMRSTPGNVWLDLLGLGFGGLEAKTGGDDFLVAQVEILEFPERLRADLHSTWADWLGDVDGELALAGAAADDLAERPGTRALRTGSFFVNRRVQVHAHFRGQDIGARTVAHALWSVSRSDGDMAMLVVAPRDGADAARKDAGRLVSDCERIGLVRAWPDRPVTTVTPVVLYTILRAGSLPFSGLGMLSARDGV
jgi:GNAT superfamily N-acetyltransferase